MTISARIPMNFFRKLRQLKTILVLSAATTFSLTGTDDEEGEGGYEQEERDGEGEDGLKEQVCAFFPFAAFGFTYSGAVSPYRQY